jgi:hypothetical protein
MIKNDHGKGLVRAYRAAGINFMAVRLEKLFVEIKTQEDIVLHNEVLKEVLAMVNAEPVGILKAIADIILFKKETNRHRKKSFLRQVADKILIIGEKWKG